MPTSGSRSSRSPAPGVPPTADVDGTPTDEIRAAGGVVVRAGADGPEVLVVHRPRYDDWSLPKGKAEPDETDEAAALREVAEETGVVAALGPEIATVRYVDGRGRAKRVRYWYMTPEAEHPITPNDEVDSVRWIPLHAVGRLLTYRHDRTLLAALESPRSAGPAERSR
jgi:8-oxo-dGTP pyrophosphatase MutT (NUDIX family)